METNHEYIAKNADEQTALRGSFVSIREKGQATNQAKMTSWAEFKTKRPYLVEIPIFLFFLAYRAALPLKEQLVYYLVSGRYFISTSGQSSLICEQFLNPQINVTAYDVQLERLIQEESSTLLSLLNFARNGPALLTTLLICSYTDVVGRRLGLILPSLGGILKCICFIALVYAGTPYFEVPLYIGEVLDGIGGSIMTGQSCAVAYIADTVAKDKRSIRFAIIQGLHFLGASLGNLIIGYLITYGFGVALWVVMSTYAASLLYVLFLLPEADIAKQGEDISVGEILHNAVAVFGLYGRKCRPRREKIILFLMLVTVICENLGLLGRNDVDVLYLISIPFCWTSIIIGYFQAARYGAKAIVGTVGIKALAIVMSDAAVGAVGAASGAAGNLLMGLATNSAMLWGVVAVSSLSGVVLPVAQSIMSKTVTTEEQGALFASLSVVTGASDMVAGTILNLIYSATVSTFPGAVFVVIAGLYSISGVNFVIVLFIKGKVSEVERQTPSPEGTLNK